MNASSAKKQLTQTSSEPISLATTSAFFLKRFLINSRLILHSERPEMIGKKDLEVILLRPAKIPSRNIMHDVMSTESVASVSKQFQLKSMKVSCIKVCTRGFARLSVKSRKDKNNLYRCKIKFYFKINKRVLSVAF